MEVGSSDTLARLRDQQDSLVSGLKHKYEEEILTLKQQLDTMSAELTDKVCMECLKTKTTMQCISVVLVSSKID